MSDLISREAVIERIKRMADGYSYLEVPTDYLIQELKKIKEAPARWMIDRYHSETYKYCCSNCGSHHRARYDYCPSCGARMAE